MNIPIGDFRSWTELACKRHDEIDENGDEYDSIKPQDVAMETRTSVEQESSKDGEARFGTNSDNRS